MNISFKLQILSKELTQLKKDNFTPKWKFCHLLNFFQWISVFCWTHKKKTIRRIRITRQLLVFIDFHCMKTTIQWGLFTGYLYLLWANTILKGLMLHSLNLLSSCTPQFSHLLMYSPHWFLYIRGSCRETLHCCTGKKALGSFWYKCAG